MPQLITQPPFDKRLTTLAYPLTGEMGVLQAGYMIWDKPLPGYSGRAVVRYLYNPSTVSADYNIADASAQASLNFPNPGDSAMLAIPLSQTAQWSLMFDRTFELWQSYESSGLPLGGNTSTGAGTLGVQADVLAFMQFTGMLTNYSYGTSSNAPATANANLAANSGIMQLVPSWAFFGNNNVANGLMYFGYINEWSVQYTHFTQFNVPMRAVVSVNWTMLPMPNTAPPSAPGLQTPGSGVLPTPGGTSTGGLPGVTLPTGSNIFSGIGGR
jgi:hypothetical protein